MLSCVEMARLKNDSQTLISYDFLLFVKLLSVWHPSLIIVCIRVGPPIGIAGPPLGAFSHEREIFPCALFSNHAPDVKRLWLTVDSRNRHSIVRNQAPQFSPAVHL